MPHKLSQLTGASSQVSPSSSMFAKRSSTRGLMISVICRILPGRLAIIRARNLNYVTLRRKQTYMDISRNARLERVWKHGEDRGYLHDICYSVHDKRLIVMISAF